VSCDPNDTENDIAERFSVVEKWLSVFRLLSDGGRMKLSALLRQTTASVFSHCNSQQTGSDSRRQVFQLSDSPSDEAELSFSLGLSTPHLQKNEFRQGITRESSCLQHLSRVSGISLLSM
jgi:hypothetical protein